MVLYWRRYGRAGGCRISKNNSGKPREGPGNRERERAGGKPAGMSRLGEGQTSREEGREFESPSYPSGRGREPGGPGAYLENHILTIDIS